MDNNLWNNKTIESYESMKVNKLLQGTTWMSLTKHKHWAKEADKMNHLLYDLIYMKFDNRWNYSVMIRDLCFSEKTAKKKSIYYKSQKHVYFGGWGGESVFGHDQYWTWGGILWWWHVLFLDLHGDFMVVHFALYNSFGYNFLYTPKQNIF